MHKFVAITTIMLALVATSPAAEARRSSNPGTYKITCYGSDCYDRYHTPRVKPARGDGFGSTRSSRSRY